MTPKLRNTSLNPAWSALLWLLTVVLSLTMLMLASFVSWPLQAQPAGDDRQAYAAPPASVRGPGTSPRKASAPSDPLEVWG